VVEVIDVTGMPQSAVVLGGGSEIGRSILVALAQRRLTRVVLVGPRESSLAETARQLAPYGAQARVLELDLTDRDAPQRICDEALAYLGEIDLVLVAAGRLGTADLAVLEPAEVASLVAVNFEGPAAAMLGLAKVLADRGQGRIVVLSSAAGYRVRKANFVYGAAKAGLDGFAQGLRDALEGSGVGVTIVRPGFVHTVMTKGKAPAPLASHPEQVAAALVRGLERGAQVVWVPPVLGPLLGLLRLLPGWAWRRLPG
jgi:decaprenylphospho-beta-D-erythro-pentofuranosid-2-ulose 2-reductase